MAILCLLKNYNTYSNRIAKRSDFSDLVDYDYVIQKNINFNPNDGVNTEQVINWNEEWLPNYLVILSKDPGESEGEDPVILQRWFVTDTDRTRKGQYLLTLRSDLIVNHYENILEAPMLINRGMVNHNNPLVFNDEGFSFNQIKKSETLLTDRHNYFPYIVLYCAKNMADKTNIPVKAEWTPSADIVLSTTIDNSIYAGGNYSSLAQDSYIYYTSNLTLAVPNSSIEYYKKFEYNSSNSSYSITATGNQPIVDSRYGRVKYTGTDTQVKDALITAINNNMSDYQNKYRLTQVGKITETDRLTYEGLLNTYTVIQDSTGKYYSVYITKQVSNYIKYDVQSSTSLYGDIAYNINQSFTNTSYNNNSFDYYYKEYTYTINVAPLDDYSFNVAVEPSSHIATNDSECNIMLLPYYDVTVVTDGTHYTTIDKNTQLNIARSIAREYTNSVIYDMQLLPYAPPSLQPYVTYNTLHVEILDESQYTKFEYDGELKGIMLWVDTSNFSFNIDKPITVNNTAIDYKIASNCDLWRLCSPNYNGQFEFNAAKNNGVASFNIDVTYRPYNPYIHVNPKFNGIYGEDFDDARGLICQGDFSLPITGDAFAQYELNNKNYLNVFNREIQHMEFTQRQERTAAGFQAVVGTIQGGVTGGAMGAMTGNPYVAAAGAAVGLAASGVGAAVDMSMLEERQREDRAYKKDMFSYQLGNIKALPYSLNKVTPLTWNNKIFPFIEYYTCTDEEKKILENRIKYDSMKLDCIDTLGNLILNYTEDDDMHFYSGSIIRLEGVDNHEAEEIYKELMKGVYL